MSPTIIRGAITLALGLLIAVPARTTGAAEAGSAPVAVHLGPGSTLWLEGTSTLHDFESRTAETVITLARDTAATAPREAADVLALVRAAALRAVEVRVPVLTLRSGKSGLDKNLWKTLKADAYPDIVFQLDRYSLPESGASADTVVVRAEGSLTIVGERRPVTLTLRAYPGDGGLWIEGRHALRMTEFGIKPPKMMLGTLRVGDRITVGYRLLLMTRESGGPSPGNGGPTPERSR